MLKRLIRTATQSALCIALATQLGFAQGNSQGHGKGNPHNNDRASINISFGVHDREIIRDYFHGGSSNLPPGLAKRGGNLPPGLQKHLERDGTLPPGLQKHSTPFPVYLDRPLPPPPSP